MMDYDIAQEHMKQRMREAEQQRQVNAMKRQARQAAVARFGQWMIETGERIQKTAQKTTATERRQGTA